MATTLKELTFSPTMQDIVASRPGAIATIMTGGNNSGKSAYLKQIISDTRYLYVGVNRFYSFHHLPLYTQNNEEIAQWFLQQKSSEQQMFQNFEGSFFNCSSAITRLSNERRNLLFKKFEELFGIKGEVCAEDANNDFSNRFVSIGGDSLSVTSSGTRLFLGLLAALMDERFLCIAIDEPELGLSPALQRKLADIIIRGIERDVLFPHKPHVVLSTHSHLFLDKNTWHNNYLVSKNGDNIIAKPCSSVTEIHNIQFNLLGNDLSELFLPDIVIFVEGETDQIFLKRILNCHLPSLRVVIEECGGDIGRRLSSWSSSLGDMQLSPYRTRTFVVCDRVVQAGLEQACRKIGLPASNVIKWSANGIEFVYPDDILSQIYRQSDISAASLEINGDWVSFGDIGYKKVELCIIVVDQLTISTLLPSELLEKFLTPLREMMR